MSDSLQAVVFDWAGTTVDYGSRAPARAGMHVFQQRDVPITLDQAREPMGKNRREHITALLAMPDVVARWKEVHGQPPTQSDVDALYASFLAFQKEVLADYGDLIPGVVETVQACRDRGLKIGGMTGDTRELIEIVMPQAAAQGYSPDVSLAADDVPNGPPAPWLLFEFAKRTGIYPMSTIVTVDDSTIGVLAGRNAGTWTVGVTKSGSELGLSQSEVEALEPDQLERKLAQAATVFQNAGVHYVVETVADLPQILDKIQIRLSAGEKP